MLRSSLVTAFLTLVAAPVIAGPACAEEAPHPLRLKAAQMFALADKARAAGHIDEAAAIYGALAKDPNIDIRSEARFRSGEMLASVGRLREAALLFRALLDERPEATPVRLELARVLAAMDDVAGARAALRQAAAAGLPPQVAAAVQQFNAGMRSRRAFGGSFEVAVAPDSNINRATSSKTLDTVIAPLTLDRSAQARSGLGLKLSGEVFARRRLTARADLLAQVSTAGVLYRERQFDDVSASFTVGPEIRLGADRWRPAVGVTQRDYGGAPYARTATVTVNWQHPVDARTQLVANAGFAGARYSRNRLQDGDVGNLAIEVQHAFTRSFGGSLGLTALRQTARDPGYATGSAGVTGLVWREAGRQTFFASATLSRLTADERLFPFTDRRKETYVRLQAGVVARRFTLHAFAPVARVTWERNDSTVGIYEFERTSVELGLQRAF